MNARQNYQPQIDWLLKGDPAVRFQTMRDLTTAKEN